MAKYTEATKKFIDFTLTFLPPPPSKRPDHESAQISFSKTRLRRDLAIIYDYRSRALHGGIAFPYSMCTPPHPNPSYFSEKPLGLELSTDGATWWYGATPMPMLLHVFEHIAREAILNWINSLPDSESAMPQPPP
jgi:hypothetical protein